MPLTWFFTFAVLIAVGVVASKYEQLKEKIRLLECESLKQQEKTKLLQEDLQERFYARLAPMEKYLANIERIAKHKRELLQIYQKQSW